MSGCLKPETMLSRCPGAATVRSSVRLSVRAVASSEAAVAVLVVCRRRRSSSCCHYIVLAGLGCAISLLLNSLRYLWLYVALCRFHPKTCADCCHDGSRHIRGTVSIRYLLCLHGSSCMRDPPLAPSDPGLYCHQMSMLTKLAPKEALTDSMHSEALLAIEEFSHQLMKKLSPLS